MCRIWTIEKHTMDRVAVDYWTEFESGSPVERDLDIGNTGWADEADNQSEGVLVAGIRIDMGSRYASFRVWCEFRTLHRSGLITPVDLLHASWAISGIEKDGGTESLYSCQIRVQG